MKKCLLLFVILSFVGIKAQVFTYSISSTPMVDVPGTTFNYNITFTNPSNNPINIDFDRYQKYNPPYWYSCFCYIMCNPPSLDFLNINLAANSSSMVTVLFKTDSVNPGVATASIRFYQHGFASNADTIHITAITQLATGVKSQNVNSISCFPNPTKGNFVFTPSENKSYDVILTDNNGRVVFQSKNISDTKYTVLMDSEPTGIYFLTVIYASGKIDSRKIIKTKE